MTPYEILRGEEDGEDGMTRTEWLNLYGDYGEWAASLAEDKRRAQEEYLADD